MVIKLLVIVGACVCTYIIFYAIAEIYRYMKETEALLLAIRRGAERAIDEMRQEKKEGEKSETSKRVTES